MNPTSTHKGKVTLEQLDVFFRNLSYRKRSSEKTRESFAPILAPKFNVFQFIRPDENRMSDILARLLDPNGKHAQGEIVPVNFLKEFCKMPDPLLFFYSSTNVHRESRTGILVNNRRRVDLLIHFRGPHSTTENFSVAIENKPWTSELNDQIKNFISEPRLRRGTFRGSGPGTYGRQVRLTRKSLARSAGTTSCKARRTWRPGDMSWITTRSNVPSR